MTLPWMPVYAADFCFETAHLSAAETGAYALLMLHYWRRGALPDDDRALSRLARMTMAQWRRSRAAIASLFQDGWRHERLDEERKGAVEVSEKRAEAGRRGAEARAKSTGSSGLLKQPPSRASTNGQPGLTQSHSQSQERVREAHTREGFPFPDDFELTPEDRAFGAAEGLSEDEITRAVSDLKLWAAEKGAERADWHATARRFMRADADRKRAKGAPSPSPSTASPGASKAAGVYVLRDSPQWEAWRQFWFKTKGKSPPSDLRGGWWFETQWPPGAEHEAA